MRRPATWPAWPRRVGASALADRRRRSTGLRLDWALLLFWVGYLALFAAGVWLVLR